MTERVLGERGSKKRKRFLLLPLLVTAMFALFWITGAQAVHDLELFELDRNATAGTAPGDDWDPAPPGAIDFTGIIVDSAAGGDQFHGGGSKDDEDIDAWLWKAGDPLDKDNITNGYAAAYTATKDTGDTDIGDIILYYGLDRFANNGSAQVGVWFFQNDISKTTVASQGGFKFSGVHRDNDILVQSNFTQGGVVSSVTVFKWLSGALVQVGTFTDCLDGDPTTPGDQPLVGDDPACATVNREDTEAPWDYTPKFGTDGFFPQGSFFEGGLNVSRLVPGAGCFTDVMVETRSSTPFDSRLFDFVLGEFQPCTATIVTRPVDANGDVDTEITIGESIRDRAVITGSGTFATPPKGSVTFRVCKVVSPTLCELADPNIQVVSTHSLATNTDNPVTLFSSAFTPSTPGRYCFRADWTGDTTYGNKSDNSALECFTVVTIPTTTTTAQSWFPNDSATISTAGPAGFNLTGSVAFSLHKTSNCSDTALYSQTVNIPASAGLEETVKTTNGNGIDGGDEAPTDFAVVAATEGTYSWLVVYTPAATDTAHTGSSSVCHDEHSALDITDNDPNIPAP
jgi:hypothetical protein